MCDFFWRRSSVCASSEARAIKRLQRNLVMLAKARREVLLISHSEFGFTEKGLAKNRLRRMLVLINIVNFFLDDC